LERDELFDLIGQRPHLLQHLFSALFEKHPAGHGVGIAGTA
jgi:hypothetical protein